MQILWKNSADLRESSTDNSPRLTALSLELQTLISLLTGEKADIRYE